MKIGCKLFLRRPQSSLLKWKGKQPPPSTLQSLIQLNPKLIPNHISSTARPDPCKRDRVIQNFHSNPMVDTLSLSPASAVVKKSCFEKKSSSVGAGRCDKTHVSGLSDRNNNSCKKVLKAARAGSVC